MVFFYLEINVFNIYDSPLLPLPLPPHHPSLPFEVGPSNTAQVSGERCKLPQRGMGRNPSGNQIWCILVLKSDIWWHLFY